MASIGSIIQTSYPSAASSTTGGSASSSSSSASSTAGVDPLANEATFMQLLVAQLKNQNPDSPVDGTTFVTQLAQFSDLEQNLAMRQDLDAISTKYDGAASGNTASTNTAGTAQSGGSSNKQSGTTNPPGTTSVQ